MKQLALIFSVLIAACAPVVDVYKMGNEYIQDAHSRNFWAPNWQRVTYCWKLENGYCPKEDTRVEVASQIGMNAPGRDAAVIAAGSVPLSLAFGLGLSQANAGRMTQSVNSQPYAGSTISTQYINGQVPAWLLKK
jgi:hypothetical protein